VIGVELGRNDYGSILCNYDPEGSWNHLPKLTPEPDSTGGESQKKYLIYLIKTLDSSD
jgi:hypothetical protein